METASDLTAEDIAVLRVANRSDCRSYRPMESSDPTLRAQVSDAMEKGLVIIGPPGQFEGRMFTTSKGDDALEAYDKRVWGKK